ncbi:rhomboid family intramembrane serine protease [Sandaracinus amylolyticus]|uniref:rhomboid family intramembrane serine protease n=1 Tax=Sandaracinus amylolyticus TaxID=927083 RepID=UPI0014704DA6|nr:rhomboid family intramembrane serine protease [Sandaracinus amylolyticus]
MTLTVVIANVLVMGLMIASGVGAMAPTAQSLLGWGANFGPYTLGGQWWRLVTACFVHAGLIHLAFNMYVLWDLGRLTERVYGALGFSLVYLVAGIGGSLASVSINPVGVSVGASGAVFGVAGAFLAFLVRNRGRIDPHVSAHLRRSLVTFVLINLALGFTLPGIDMAAHVGGLVMGFLTGLLATPTVTREGPQRAYWAYPVVAAVGAAMCGIAWLGVPLMR